MFRWEIETYKASYLHSNHHYCEVTIQISKFNEELHPLIGLHLTAFLETIHIF